MSEVEIWSAVSVTLLNIDMVNALHILYEEDEMMRRHLWMYVLGLTIVSVSVWAEKPMGMGVGKIAPGFALSDLSGREYTLSTMSRQRDPGKGTASCLSQKITYLVFFATWCSKCKEEIPVLNEIYEGYREQGLEMMGITVGEKPKLVDRFLKKQGIKYPVLLDTTSMVSRQYQLKGFPLNVIIDECGIIQFIGSEPPEDFQRLFARIRSGRGKVPK